MRCQQYPADNAGGISAPRARCWPGAGGALCRQAERQAPPASPRYTVKRYGFQEVPRPPNWELNTVLQVLKYWGNSFLYQIAIRNTSIIIKPKHVQKLFKIVLFYILLHYRLKKQGHFLQCTLITVKVKGHPYFMVSWSFSSDWSSCALH